MSRTNDFLFIFSGGEPFAKQFRVEDEVSTQLYVNKRSELSYGRKLLAESRGAGPDVNANIDELMRTINSFTGNRLDTIGNVCLLGRSEGCALALGLAGELHSKGLSELTFVGLSDVPMWDEGRDPPVRHVGKFKPQNGPIATGAVGPNPGIGGRLSVSPVPQNLIPVVSLDCAINAKKKINLYQIQGNHMRWANKLKRWIWWADFSGGEVHGKLEGGFEDRLRRVKGSFFGDDLVFHVNLNTGSEWKAMCSEAANALADLPAQPLP